MIEIFPNWHPVFVHFSVGVLFLSIFLFYAATILRREPLHSQLVIAAQWNLWLGVVITVGTVFAGFVAFNSVDHTGAAHPHMLDHRNWALGTATIFVILAGWSLLSALKGADFAGTGHAVFLVLLTVAGIGLAATGYKGGELVFRYGVGVLPAAEQEAASAPMRSSTGDEIPGHNHDHSHGDHSH
jgi:uncharacterized membrane protein